jgi:hypothetical protein
MTLTLHVSVHIYDHFQGARKRYFYAITKIISVDVGSLRVFKVLLRV